MGRALAGGEWPNILDRLVAAAGLPAVVAVEPIENGYGLDNQLTKAVLIDGRVVLMRRSRVQHPSPRPRMEFLRSNGIVVPVLHAADDAGASLWEYVPGRPLADQITEGSVTDPIWNRLGATLATVHAVTFPGPLQGPIGPDSVTLRPADPVEQLRTAFAARKPWVEQHRPMLTGALRRLSMIVSDSANDLRAQQPAVAHGDVNFLNIIVDDDTVRLIDWDSPAVRYPLAELAALEEHAYLHGIEALPTPFYDGYGETVRTDLLLIYRIVGCLGWISSSEWTEWEHSSSIPSSARDRLRRWHRRLFRWTERIPDLIAAL